MNCEKHFKVVMDMRLDETACAFCEVERLQAELAKAQFVLDAAMKYVEAGNIDGFRGHEIKRAVSEYKKGIAND